MNRGVLYLAIAAALAMLVWSGHRSLQQRGDAQAAVAQYELVAGQATELARMKAAAPAESRRPRPAPGIASRLAGAVATAGLPQSTLQKVTPEQESVVNAGAGSAAKYRRMAVRLTLDPITLPELGRFFNQWRVAEPVWTVSTIELAPTSHSTKDNLKNLRAALVLETVFADDGDRRPGEAR